LNTDYDVIIIGSGPAGIAAGLYTSRARLKTLILEKEMMGGELMNRDLIENYPGFSEGVAGPDLGSAMLQQIMNFGAEIELAEVTDLEVESGVKIVKTEGQNRTCKSLIIASGARPRKLGVPGEAEFTSKGVIYCATCDGPQFMNKTVAVAGAGDSGITEGLFLTRIATKVLVIEILAQPKATKVLLERASSNPKIEIRCGTRIEAITGNDHVRALELQDMVSGTKSRLEVEGILVHIGVQPNTQFTGGLLSLDTRGQIPVNENMETAIAGIFAAGDVRQSSPMQIGTAVGDGVNAAMSAGRYLSSL
jgi:thioredoxin reductase (NADPH)